MTQQMHAFSVVTLGIFVAGYWTARWNLMTRMYELSTFACNYGEIVRPAKGSALLSTFVVLLVLPFARIAADEIDQVNRIGTYTFSTGLTNVASSNHR